MADSSLHEEEEDLFDTLPDAILLLIFSKLSHAKSLSQCLPLCKRFASLIHQTDTVFLPTLPQKRISKSAKSIFKSLLRKFVAQKSHKKTGNISYYSPVHLLKNFNFIKSLHIQVPCIDSKIGLKNRKSNADSLLKWKAEFGSEFKNCVVLVANKFNQLCNHGEENFGGNQNLSDEELKMRIIQTISCLIALSARHCLLKQILDEHKSIENVRISDVEKQGILSLGKDEIAEMRNSMKESSSMEVTSRVPDLKMKLWYVPVVKLPKSGYVMEGATLVLIRPVVGKGDDGGDGDGDCGGGEMLGFDGEEDEKMGLDEAVKEIVKMEKNYYVMTVNSF
ncbi:F-box protein At4g18380-like [Euphorbia lathyris]|uniref:F-box protein At4g18380-like n=1 Tax=Euphorbia lathyris TaxID=212925 RepID=UPI003313F8D9